MKIELKPIDSLIPYIRNPRVNQKAVPKVKSSIKEFGFRQPIVVDTDNVIVVGHTRWLAAKELGIKEVPVHVADSLTSSQIQAYRIADNRTNQDSSWDEELLKIELIDLKASGFNLELTGFEAKELCGYVSSDKEDQSSVDETESTTSKAEECQQKWNVEVGDIYQCGNHRILCGDCADQSAISRLLENNQATILLTDPPYGIKMDKGFSGELGFNGKGKSIPRRQYTDEWDSERPSTSTFQFILSLAKTSIIWGGNFFADQLPMSTHWLVWDKHQTMPTFGDCELAWTSSDRKSVKKYDVEYNGLIGKEKERWHPTQKPTKLFTSVIEDYAKVGEIVLDVYAGSGTTLIACEQTNRIARLCERSPEYVAVTLERWSTLTGQQPVKL